MKTLIIAAGAALLTAAAAFAPYQMLRTHDGGHLGFDPVFTLLTWGLLTVFIVPLWAIPYVAGVTRVRIADGRAASRSRRGLCIGCAYEIDASAAVPCPECGRPDQVWPERGPGFERLANRVACAIVIGTLAAATAGEARVLADERAFRREAHAHLLSGRTELLQRRRAWPAESRLMFDPKGADRPPAYGFFAAE